ncbi:BofC C-terminal domain-containing protein [Paenibacillus hodogayensis]|uniref:BofC C-terminal domain-containing protein n=1 Tax=Paenibacillus hodogayensis TaxID=279208 RepID=A0ABV5VVR9_9BACL
MNLSSLYKQLKKRLRQKRRWLSLGFFIVAATAGLLTFRTYGSPDAPGRDVAQTMAVPGGGTAQQDRQSEQTLQVWKQLRESGGIRDVFMHKTYVCGEENLLIGRMGPDDAIKLHAEHPEWQVELREDGSVSFSEHIDDLSPACKSNAYFGLDKTGNLSLFEGPPDDEKVIRTFFQLNMGYLESSLHPDAVGQLKQGIRVLDMEEYNSVLSTFSEFAVEESERVMKSARGTGT